MLGNIIASGLNDIPFHIRSSLNVKLFKQIQNDFAQRLVDWVLLCFFGLILKNIFVIK